MACNCKNSKENEILKQILDNQYTIMCVLMANLGDMNGKFSSNTSSDLIKELRNNMNDTEILLTKD